MKTTMLSLCLLVALVCSSNVATAAVSKEMILVGKIASFDQTHVTVKSGTEDYVFLKEDLDLPSYKVGNPIEVPTNEEKLSKAKVRKSSADKTAKPVSRK
jgi:hypothetical protein